AAGSRDHRTLRSPRHRPDPRHRPVARHCARSRRRLAEPAARPRHHAPARCARLRPRLRREGPSARSRRRGHHQRGRGSLPRAVARLGRAVAAGRARAAAGGTAASPGAGREAQIDAALRAWYSGFVADSVERFCRIPVPDETGRAHAGLLTAADLDAWRPGYEPTVNLPWRGLTIHKAGPWTQGPALLQQLGMLDALGELPPPGSAARVHRVVEVAKLAFADREAW